MKTKNDYEIYVEKQKELAVLVKEYADIMEQLGDENESQEAIIDSEKIESQNFEIAVVGSFKNGKSTFINALLGKEVLPAYARPCTAIINEVQYAKKESAVLFFKENLSEEQMSVLPEWIKKEIKEKDVSEGITVPMKHLQEVLTIPMGECQEDFETPYSKLVLYYPLELLKNHVVITDTPGLNEMETRTRITTEHLQKADAIIMVFSADKLCSQVEMKFVQEDLKKNGFDNPFFIVNRIDTVKRDKDLKEIKELAISKLSKYTKKGQDNILFISSADALDGKIDRDYNLIEKSNFIPVEDLLSDYLTHERGREKLFPTLNKIENILKNHIMEDLIPNLKKGLTLNKQQAIIKQFKANETLEKAEVHIENIIKILDSNTEIYIKDLSRDVDAFYTELQNKIVLWVDNYKPKKNDEINPKKHAEIAQREILDFLSEEMKSFTDDWYIEYKKLVEEKNCQLKELIKKDLYEFEKELQKSKIEFFGERYLTESTSLELLNNYDDTMKILCSEMLKNIGKSVGIATGVGVTFELLTGLMNPFIGIAVAVGSIAFGAFRGAQKAVVDIKENIKAKVCESIKNESVKEKIKIEKQTTQVFESNNMVIKNALDNKYKRTKKSIDETVKALKKGSSEIVSKLKTLDDLQSKSNDLYQKIINLKGEL